MNDISKE